MAASINALTPSDIAIALKQHRSLSDLCYKYQCTREEIAQRLRRIYTNDIYPAKVLTILHDNDKQRQRDLNRRSKNRRKSSRSANSATIAPPPSSQLEPHGNPEHQTNPQSIVDNLSLPQGGDHPSQNANSNPVIDNTAELHQAESICRDHILELESQYRKLTTKHSTCLSQLKDLQNDLQELQHLLDTKCTDYAATLTATKATVRELNALSTQHRQEIEHLRAIQAQIIAQEPVSIGFYANGEIEVMSDSNFTPDDNNSAQIYSQLIDNPNCQDLRIREIHILARAIAIQENTPHPIEPIFENAELEQPYHVIIASLATTP